MFSATKCALFPGALLVAAFSLAASPVLAQTDPGDPGPLPRPRPYFGTKTLGNPPAQYPAPGTPAPDPVRYWKGRIISSGGWGSPAIIIINNTAPCYVPAYYFGSDYYNGVSISYRAQFGNFSLGMNQRTGFGGGYVYGGGFYSGPYYSGLPVYSQPHFDPSYRMSRNGGKSSRDSTRTRRQTQEAEEEADDYYLNRKPGPLQQDPALAEAVRNIEASFRTGDITMLEKHVVPTDKIVVQSQGRTRRSISAADYLKMTREALQVMKTARYTLNQVEPGSQGTWMVYGTHVLRGEDGAEKTFNVGFVLKRRGDGWAIAEVSADPAK